MNALLDESLANEKPARIKQTGYRLQVQGAKPAAYKTKMADADVLECRRLYEREGARPADLAIRFGVSREYVYSLVHYATRSKLIPR